MAQRVLSGSIRSIQDKSPLIGVTIQIEHTSIGTTTDEQGNYVLKNIPIGKSTIVFSCVGLKRTTKTVFFSESESKNFRCPYGRCKYATGRCGGCRHRRKV